MILSIASVFIRAVLAPVACFFDRVHRSRILRNLAIAFPGMSPEARARIPTGVFEQFFMNLLLAFVKPPADSIVVHGLDHLDACRRSGRGAIVLLSHFGAWELMSQLGDRLRQYDIAAVYQPLRNRWLNDVLERFRSRSGVRLLNRRTRLMEACHRVKNGGIVGVFVDQHAGDHGMWVPFFGKLASTSVLPLVLKGTTDAALIPAFCRATGPGQWRIDFGREIEPGSGQGETLHRIHEVLERRIVENPEMYFWLHNRWKTPNRHIFFYHYRRGFFIPKGIRLKPFRVLVRGVNWLGDAVLTIPALRAIKTGRPDTHMTLMTEPKLADFWKGQYYIDRVVGVDEPLKEEFDVGIVLPNSFNSALQVYQNEVEAVVGYAGEFPRRFLLDVVVPESCRAGFRRHDVFDFLGLAEYIGAGYDKAVPVYGLLKNLLAREDTVAMHIGASYGSAKRWPEENFIELARKFPEFHWLLIGAPDEFEMNQRVAQQIGDNAVAAETNLSELAKLLATVRCLVCNDSGPMHFAASVGTPVVGIFGSTEPALTGPLGDGHRVVRGEAECSPCFLRECPIDLRCMKSIKVESVEKALRAVLAGSAAAALNR